MRTFTIIALLASASASLAAVAAGGGSAFFDKDLAPTGKPAASGVYVRSCGTINEPMTCAVMVNENEEYDAEEIEKARATGDDQYDGAQSPYYVYWTLYRGNGTTGAVCSDLAFVAAGDAIVRGEDYKGVLSGIWTGVHPEASFEPQSVTVDLGQDKILMISGVPACDPKYSHGGIYTLDKNAYGSLTQD